ncbi:MAG: sugar ABC transporter ATP-binding protein [Anaerolineae bacterium]|nr:sugar ABC transporter ATP-binding protein [Anaerolineae bacterium]
MSFLRLENVSKAYPGVQALRGVSFEIERGQVHALVGENGAGKSTLIKILAGAEQADGGTITLDGAPYTPRDPRAALDSGVATIYQVFNLLPDRTVMQNVMLGKEPHSRGGWMDVKSMHEQTRRVMERLNAAYLPLDCPVGLLKVSERQVVEIAKALLNDSKLLIMDEPTSALNQTEVEALFTIVDRLKAQGVTILYVSHRLEEIFRLADAVTVLRDGGHISTKPISAVTRDSLIEDMIGRKLVGVFPAKSTHYGEEVLRAEHLRARGLLDDVSVSLHRGEVLAVAGLSGSGKSELGRALFGDLPLDGGSILLKGAAFKPSPERAMARGLIYLPEDRKAEGILQEMSIRKNIALPVLRRIANPFGFVSPEREREVAQAQVKALDIKTPGIEQLVLNLSGGNQQKVALAKCLALDPEILIFMEPTQGIDVGVKFDLYQFIAAQAQAGRAVLLISSELVEILGLAQRILVMREGRIAADLDGQTATQTEILRHALGETSEATPVT